MTQTIQTSTAQKAAYLLEQLQLKLGLSQDQVARELGVPRSSFARYVSSKGTLPDRWLTHAFSWIARSLGLQPQQVEQFVHADQPASAPVALLELNGSSYLQIQERTPSDIAASLTRRWQQSCVSIFCPSVPPLFLLTKEVRDSISDWQQSRGITSPVLERSARMHAAIARQMWLFPELCPSRWELIVPQHTIDAMRSRTGPFSKVSNDGMTELLEIWHHDLEVERRLNFRALPDCEAGRTVIRHFANTMAVVLIDENYRWKESDDQRQVQVMQSEHMDNALHWDLQAINLARSLCEGESPWRHGIAGLFGDDARHQKLAMEMKALRIPVAA